MEPKEHDTRMLIKLVCLLLIANPALTSEPPAHVPVPVPVLILTDNCAPWNAALCKPAYQITNFWGGVASRGVDDNRNPEFFGSSCFHTFSTIDNWWMVDLMDEFLVHEVVVTNRDDTLGHKFNNVSIDFFLTDPRDDPAFPNNPDGVQCNEVTESFEGTRSFECLSPAYARYVKMLRTTVGQFHACEVEVMVSKKRGDPECVKMIPESFNVLNNSVVENGVIVTSTTMRRRLDCVDLCVRQGDPCNGVYWTGQTKHCQLITVNPYELGNIIETTGTDCYVQSPIECTGVGEWVYV